ncbi:hypothetical protein PVAP13_9NG553814, partial [Panicum virgatum]
LLASAGSGCTSPGGCRSSTTGAPSGGSSGGSGNRKKGGGPRRGNGGGNGGCGRTQQASNSAAPQPYRPMGPWICYNLWAPQGPSPTQQQGPAPGAWRPGLLGAAPQAHTAFAPVQVSSPTPTWDQAGLIAALN